MALYRNTDGLLDVVGVRTLFQLGSNVTAQANVMGGIHRLAQTDSVQFRFSPPSEARQHAVHVQVDGEGMLLLNPTSVTIRRGHRTLLLRSTGEPLP